MPRSKALPKPTTRTWRRGTLEIEADPGVLNELAGDVTVRLYPYYDATRSAPAPPVEGRVDIRYLMEFVATLVRHRRIRALEEQSAEAVLGITDDRVRELEDLARAHEHRLDDLERS